MAIDEVLSPRSDLLLLSSCCAPSGRYGSELIAGQEMPREEERVREQRGNHGAPDDCRDEVGILSIVDDAVRKSK